MVLRQWGISADTDLLSIRIKSRTERPSSILSSNRRGYFFRCPETSLVISNIETDFLPLKTAFSASSALIWVFFFDAGAKSRKGVRYQKSGVRVFRRESDS